MHHEDQDFRGLSRSLRCRSACHHDAAKPVTPTTHGRGRHAAAAKHRDAAEPRRSHAAISRSARASRSRATSPSLCGIKPIANVNPTFDYDKDELTSDDRNILQQLAACMTSGKLKGKSVALVGRADPRGTEEYNLGLGSKRASSVSAFLGAARRAAVAARRHARAARSTRPAPTSAGYRADRRVDVQLKTGG